jgi:hypothetical protein
VGETLKRQFALSGWIMLVAISMLAAYDAVGGSNALSQECPTGNLYTIENHNKYPIWLGEFVGDPTKVVVPTTAGALTSCMKDTDCNNLSAKAGQTFDCVGRVCKASGWRLSAGGDGNSIVSLCTTPPFPSGRFWARTECDFNQLYQVKNPRPGAFTSCMKDTDCNSLSMKTGQTFDCLGGVCMVDCTQQCNISATTGACTGTTADAFCRNTMGIPANTNAICSTNTPSPTFQVCTYGGGIVCKTGDCAGDYQCVGTWTNKGVAYNWIQGGNSPASLFEPTATGADVVNYDVSVLAGYNTDIGVKVSPQPPRDVSLPDNCFQPKCESDLNATCPLNLQLTEAPTTDTKAPVPCNDNTRLYCQSGSCEPCQPGSGQSCDEHNLKTCVIGCNGPGEQCAAKPGNAKNLDCNSVIPNPSDDSWKADGSTYYDMYQSANKSLNVDTVSSHEGTSLSSQLQGNPTCWEDTALVSDANIDCPPSQVCDTDLDPTLEFPPGVGVCVFRKDDTPTGDTGGLQPQINCSAPAEDPGGPGEPCGGYYVVIPNGASYTPPRYPDALGYKCKDIVINAGGHDHVSTLACLPGSTVGLGTYEISQQTGESPLYTGTGSYFNPEWLAAAKWATGDGSRAAIL